MAQQSKYTQLLLDEPPLVVLPSLAVKYGLEEALRVKGFRSLQRLLYRDY